MHSKHMLFLSGDRWPVVYQFLKKVFNCHLVERGWEVTWVFPSLDVDEVTQIEWNGSEVFLIPKRYSNSALGNIRDAWRTFKSINSIFKDRLDFNKYDMIWVRDEPIMSLFAFVYGKVLNNTKLCFQLSHFKAEEIIIRGMSHKSIGDIVKGLIGKYSLMIMMRKYDKIFAISDFMKENLVSWYGLKEKCIVSLPEGVDAFGSDHLVIKEKETIRESIRNKYQIKKDSYVLIYAGTLNRFRNLELLIHILPHIKLNHDVYLMFIGGAVNEEDVKFLEAEAIRFGVSDRCIFTGHVPHDEVINYLIAADIGLSPFPPNKVLMNNSPIKILEYWNAGLPVVASKIPDQIKLVSECGGGILVDHNLDEYVVALRLMLGNIDKLNEMGKSGKIYVKKCRDFRILSDFLNQRLNEVLDK